MKTVRQLLGDKGQVVHTISPHATVYDALRNMADHDVGALVVLADGEVVGVISERDYARKVILLGKGSREIPVSEIMSQEVVSVTSKDSVDGCMTLMTERRIRHLPVVENGQLAGIVSIGDVVKTIMDQQARAIEELEHYITGSR